MKTIVTVLIVCFAFVSGPSEAVDGASSARAAEQLHATLDRYSAPMKAMLALRATSSDSDFRSADIVYLYGSQYYERTSHISLLMLLSTKTKCDDDWHMTNQILELALAYFDRDIDSDITSSTEMINGISDPVLANESIRLRQAMERTRDIIKEWRK